MRVAQDQRRLKRIEERGGQERARTGTNGIHVIEREAGCEQRNADRPQPEHDVLTRAPRHVVRRSCRRPWAFAIIQYHAKIGSKHRQQPARHADNHEGRPSDGGEMRMRVHVRLHVARKKGVHLVEPEEHPHRCRRDDIHESQRNVRAHRHWDRRRGDARYVTHADDEDAGSDGDARPPDPAVLLSPEVSHDAGDAHSDQDECGVIHPPCGQVHA